MKVIATLFFFIIFASIALAETKHEVPVGRYLPDTRLQGLLAQHKQLSDYRGKPLIINVWASWCGPCREEMPSIQRLSTGKYSKQFNVIGISTDDDAYAAASFIKGARLTFNNYIDHDLVLESLLGANTIPLTILVDARGVVVKKIYGARNWDSTESIEIIKNTFKIK